jgi:hypothetical protein
MTSDVRRVLMGLGAFVAAFAWADGHISNSNVGVPAFAFGICLVAIALIRD